MSTMIRRRLRKDVIPSPTATPTPTSDMLSLNSMSMSFTEGGTITKSQLVLVGYNDAGEPIWKEEPCMSNDNPDPFGWNCTEAPTGMPSDGGNGEGEGDGTGSGSTADSDTAEMIRNGKLAYECTSSSELCSLHRPGDSIPPTNAESDGTAVDDDSLVDSTDNDGTVSLPPTLAPTLKPTLHPTLQRGDGAIDNSNGTATSDDDDGFADTDDNLAGTNSTNNGTALIGTNSTNSSISPSSSSPSSNTNDLTNNNSPPWTLLGPCNFNSTTCPKPYATYITDQYKTGDQVSIVVDRWVYTCMGDDCNYDGTRLEDGVSWASYQETQVDGKDDGVESSGTAGEAMAGEEAVVSMGNSTSDSSGGGVVGNSTGNSTGNATDISTGDSTAISTGNPTGTSAGSAGGNSTGASSTDGGQAADAPSLASSGEQSSGWKLAGGCQTGQDCPDEYDDDRWYAAGDEVSTSVSHGTTAAGGSISGSVTSGDSYSSGSHYGSSDDGSENDAPVSIGIDYVGVGTGGGSGTDGSSVANNTTEAAGIVDGGDVANNATDGFDAGEEGGNVTDTIDGNANNATPNSSSSSGVKDTGNPGNVTTTTTTSDSDDSSHEPASYAYECTSDRYCNSYPPGNSLGLGWTIDGTCRAYIDCPERYDDAKAAAEAYVEGDSVVISSDYLNDQVIGSISCPNARVSGTISQPALAAAGTNENEVLVPYAYEVETSLVSNAEVFLPRLEEQILLDLADGMMSCLGGRRTLRKNNVRILNDEREEAEFAVGGIMSRPDDMAVTKGPCTISTPEADNCFIISGGLTLLLTPPINSTSYNSTESAAAATDAAQKNLQTAMEEDDLLSPNMPEVLKVRYLGDSYEKYLAGFVEGESGLSGGIVSSLPVSGGGDDDDDDGGGLGFIYGILGAVFGAMLIIMCASLFIRRRRTKARQEEKNAMRMSREHDSQAVGGDFDWEDWDESFDVNDPNNGGGANGGGVGGGANGEVILHVGNVSPNTTADDIRELFEQHGTVNNCIIPQDHQDRVDGDSNSERFALLTMPWTTNEAERAEAENACVHVHGLEVDGHVLGVKEVTTLYVGNVSPDTTEEDVRNLFEQHGTVTGCIIPSDHQQNGGGAAENTTSRGRFALVTMPTDEASDATNHVHGSEVDGNVLNVRDTKQGGRGIPGGGLAAAALAAGAMGAVAAFNRQRFNPQGKDEVALRVGNLGPETTEEDVRELFEEYGTVTECVIPSDEEEGGDARRRFALVTMPAEEAESACDYVNGMEVDGHQLSVREAQGQNNTGGAGGMAGRNLMDDASSAYGNSYYGRPSSGGSEGDRRGMMASLGALGGVLSTASLFKSFKKKKNKSQDEDSQNQLAHSYGNSPDTEQSLDDGLDSIINTIDGATDTQDRRNFVVDPPGAFHLGNHHYTGDGLRYFSPLCELCIAARADADGVVALNTISEDDDDDDDNYPEDESMMEGTVDLADDLSFDLEAAKNFTDFNSNDLGRNHSSMHVRHCKSTTCTLCRVEKGVYFLKSRRDTEATAAASARR